MSTTRVQDFADDLKRFLQSKPILARPPSVFDRVHKWSRRHRAFTLASNVRTGLRVAIGSVISAGLIWRANGKTQHALAESQRNFREAKKQRRATALAREVAERRARENKAVVDFLINDLLAAADPSYAQGLNLKVIMCLANAESKVNVSLKDQPLVEASVRHAMGKVYNGLGDFKSAQRHLTRASELRRHFSSQQDPATIESRHELALVHNDLGDHETAERIIREVLADNRQVRGRSILAPFGRSTPSPSSCRTRGPTRKRSSY